MLRFIMSAAIVLAMGTMAMGDTHLSRLGTTFPQPLYERWAAEYGKLHADIRIDYGGGGSGKGIKDITDGVVDFAGSNAPMVPVGASAGGGANLIEFPTCAGGLVPAYNLKDIADLKFDGQVLAEIYMGKISSWDDAKIAALNPGVNLPKLAIAPVFRTKGSGSTFVFTSYLSAQNDDLRKGSGSASR